MKKVIKALLRILKSIMLIILLIAVIALLFPMFEGSSLAKREVDGSNNWMDNISGELKLNQIVVPGTHDSATYSCSLGLITKCQSLNIKQQLEAGYRFLDIRLMVADDNKLTLCHGFTHCKTSYSLGARNLDLNDVLDDCYSFLNDNPSETIMFVVKQEYGDESVTEFESILNDYINDAKDYWLLTDTIPTLDESRGKIVLFRRYQDEAGIGINSGIEFIWENQNAQPKLGSTADRYKLNNFTLAVQDRYCTSVDVKWNVFSDTVSEYSNLTDDVVLVNFLSTKGTMSYGCPYYFALKLNNIFAGSIEVQKDLSGWIICDFCSADQAQLIYSQNYNY